MTRLNESVVATAFNIPAESFCEQNVVASGVDIDSGRWFFIVEGTMQKSVIKKGLGDVLGKTKYFTSRDKVYESTTASTFALDTTKTNPSSSLQTVISGTITTRRVRRNPVSVAEFREEMNDMKVTKPERDFTEYDSSKLHSPSFRNKLWEFVTYRGEAYGWVKGNKIYHRRGSLIMPKVKINKMVEGAKTFYHTHPSKDEPSLSSADDYQFYADAAFAFGTTNFYTIMEKRIDHFVFSVKKASEEDYLKMDEEKLLNDIESIISVNEKKMSKKHGKDSKLSDEAFNNKLTRGVVSDINRQYSDFFHIKYKGHVRPSEARANPGVAGFRPNPAVRIDPKHDSSVLNEIKDTSYNFEHYGANEYGHSAYVYWWVDHYFSPSNIHPMGRLWKLKDLGLDDETRRELRAYMSEEVAPGYSKLDMLLFLALYHDVGKKREMTEGRHHSVIGAEMFANEISLELTLPQSLTDPIVHLMMTDCGRKNISPEGFVTQAGDYYGVAVLLQIADMLAHHPYMFTSMASEAKQSGFIDKANVDLYKKRVAEENFRKIGEFLSDRPLNNPPPVASSVVYRGSFESPIDGDIASELLAEMKSPSAKDILTPNQSQMSLYDEDTNMKMTLIVKDGSYIIRANKKDGHYTDEDPYGYDRVMSVVSKVGSILQDIHPDIYIGEVEPAIMVNPRHADRIKVITISGPSGVGKSTIARTIAGLLDASLVPTVTTRKRRPKELEGGDRVFVSQDKFKEMIDKGDLVEWRKQKNGHYYGRRYSDFSKETAVVDVTLNGVTKYRKAFSNITSIFLDPDVSPAELSKRIMRRGGMTKEEAEARARIASNQVAQAHTMPFDMFVKSRSGDFEQVAKEIVDDIVKQNPPTKGDGPYYCPACGVYGQHDTEWRCTEHTPVKENAPIFEARPSPEEYVAQRIQAGSKLTPNGHQFRNTISSTRALRERLDLRREIVSLAFTKKVDDIYQPFKQDAIREGWSAIRKHVARVKDGGIFRWNENFPEDWNDKVWTIDEMIENGGVCRHLGMLSGMLLERAIEEGVLKGQVYYFRGVGHGWALYRDRMGRDQIIDPAQSYWGPMGEKEYYGGKHDLNSDGIKTEYYEPYSKRSVVPDSLPVRQLRGLQAQASPEMKAMLRSNPKEGPDLYSHFERWAKLVNMKNKELEAFLDSPVGKTAGLSAQEAKDKGIFSGRVSGRRILKMRKKLGLGGPKDYIKGPRHLDEMWEVALKKWTGPSENYMKGSTDWDWCMRQVRFNERHGAFPYNKNAEERKGPLVRKQKTQNRLSRRLLSLWVWGHDPWRWARKNGIARMPKCPNVPWVGMTEKKKYGKVEVNVKANPPTGLRAIDMIPTHEYTTLLKMVSRRLRPKQHFGKTPDNTMQIKVKKRLKEYGYTGVSAKSAIEAVFQWHLDKWPKKGKKTIYRAIFTPYDIEALDKQWKRFGLMESWGSNKHNADLYVFHRGTLAMMPTGNQALIEAHLSFSDVNWATTIRRNVIFGISEDEIVPIVWADLLVKKVSFYQLDDRARDKYNEGIMGIGRNWKPWVDPKFKPFAVWEPEEYYPVEGPDYKELFAKADNDYLLPNPMAPGYQSYVARRSPTHGKGLFATDDISKGVVLLDMESMRYLNHSSSPNIVFQQTDDYLMTGVTSKNIGKGEEIVGDYRQLAKLTGHPAAGADVPPETLYNPMAPGYQSYGWTTQDWRSIKVNNKGDIDYSEKCGAKGTKTPSGSPRLCLPKKVIQTLMRSKSGKEVLREQARKKARAKKGERVPWHPRIKKLHAKLEEKTPKDRNNPQTDLHGNVLQTDEIDRRVAEQKRAQAALDTGLHTIWSPPSYMPAHLMPANLPVHSVVDRRARYVIQMATLNAIETNPDYVAAREADRSRKRAEAIARRDALGLQPFDFSDAEENPPSFPSSGPPIDVMGHTMSGHFIARVMGRVLGDQKALTNSEIDWEQYKETVEYANSREKAIQWIEGPFAQKALVYCTPIPELRSNDELSLRLWPINRPSIFSRPQQSTGPRIYNKGEKIPPTIRRFLEYGLKRRLTPMEIKEHILAATEHEKHRIPSTISTAAIKEFQGQVIRGEYQWQTSSGDTTSWDSHKYNPSDSGQWAFVIFKPKTNGKYGFVTLRTDKGEPSGVIRCSVRDGRLEAGPAVGKGSDLHQGTGYYAQPIRNPSNIPFPVPEEYREELERRLTEEMTSEGYRPHTIPEVIKEGLYDDQPSDFAYAQGEYEEFLEEIEKGDLDEAYAEYSDVEGHVAYWLWTNHRIHVPIYTGTHVTKTRARIQVFRNLFDMYGLAFGPQYLKGGSNYEKVHKVRNVLKLASRDQGKPEVTDTDEQIAQKVAAAIAMSANAQTHYPDNLAEAFEIMKKVAKKNRELEMTEGFDAYGWWKAQKKIIDDKYGKEPIRGASWLLPVFDPDFDPNVDEKDPSMDDFYPLKPGQEEPDVKMHFYNQLMRIPQTEPPTPRKVLQVALNVGQGHALGIVSEDYKMEDFLATK